MTTADAPEGLWVEDLILADDLWEIEHLESRWALAIDRCTTHEEVVHVKRELRSWLGEQDPALSDDYAIIAGLLMAEGNSLTADWVRSHPDDDPTDPDRHLRLYRVLTGHDHDEYAHLDEDDEP